MKVISIVNQKGGVGKTTIAYHLALGLYEKGYKTLLIDLDPQGNLSKLFGKDSCGVLSAFEKETNKIGIEELGNGIGLSTANSQLAGIEFKMKVSLASYLLLKRAITGLRYHFCVLDCPPALSFLTLNALSASHLVLIPVLPSLFSFFGFKELTDLIGEIGETGLNSNLKILGVIVNQMERTNVSRDALNSLKEKFKDLLFNVGLPKTVRVEEALQKGKPVWNYEPDHLASIAFQNLIQELIEKVDKKERVEK